MGNLFPYDQNHPSLKILFQRNVMSIKLQDMGKATTAVCIAVNKAFAMFVGSFSKSNINVISGNLPLNKNFRIVPETFSVPV